MAGRSDNKQFDLKLFGKFDNVTHRMSGYDMRIEFDMVQFGHLAGALQDLVKPPRGRACLLSNLLDEFRHVIDLLDRNHMKF